MALCGFCARILPPRVDHITHLSQRLSDPLLADEKMQQLHPPRERRLSTNPHRFLADILDLRRNPSPISEELEPVRGEELERCILHQLRPPSGSEIAVDSLGVVFRDPVV